MANFQDQAKAIWTALDNMLERDPEGYKQFVAEQLKEGQSFLKQTGSLKVADGLEDSFKGLSFEHGQGDVPSKSENKAKKGPKSGSCVPNKIPAAADDGKDDKNRFPECADGSNDKDPLFLLDDEIGTKSIIAQIVKKTREDDEEETTSNLKGLELPSTQATKAIKKPMIEEL